jgi:nucleotide-binding universal stress UspA family protein
MFKNIIVPLDGSRLAEAALPYAMSFAQAFVSTVSLVHVLQRSELFWVTDENRRYIDALEERARNAAQHYLDEKAKEIGSKAIRVSSTIVDGAPAEVLSAYGARPADTGDLIALSTHGRGGLGRFFLGSVTDRILQSATTPLLIVRPKDDGIVHAAQLASLIVPLDGSALAETILPVVIEVARGLSLRVNLVQIVPVGSVMYGGVESMYAGNLLQEMQDSAEAYLERIAENLRVEGLLVDKQVMLHHHAGAGVVDLAKDLGGSLIAISTHGRTGFDRWMLGSVTDHVVRTGGSPVLVVRPEAGA